MSQQPAWRGHRAPVEDPDRPGPLPGPAPRRRRRWVIGLIVALGLAAVAGGVWAASLVREPGATPDVPEVRVSDCLASVELARGQEIVSELDVVPCTTAHDAEVFALLRMLPGEELDAVSPRCAGAGGAHRPDVATLTRLGLEIRPLALDPEPAAGDPVACFVRRKDGAPLTRAVTTPESAR